MNFLTPQGYTILHFRRIVLLKDAFIPKENPQTSNEDETKLVEKILKEIMEMFREQRISVSPRVRTAIVNYWKAASACFDDEKVEIRKSEETVPDNSKDAVGNEGKLKIITIAITTDNAEKTIHFPTDEYDMLEDGIKTKIDNIKSTSVDKKIVAIDYAIAQRILPSYTILHFRRIVLQKEKTHGCLLDGKMIIQ